jgi:hypothetical protein
MNMPIIAPAKIEAIKNKPLMKNIVQNLDFHYVHISVIQYTAYLD